MGTKDQKRTVELQKELRLIAARLGLSLPKLADKIFDKSYSPSNAEEEDQLRIRFRESFKKQLERKTTNPDFLSHHIDTISRTSEFRDAHLVFPTYIKSDSLDNELRETLEKISRELSFCISNKD
ncbi:MAG: hypothetical protein Q7T36_12855 [Fluviicoccus sp.]|uniref:hypothetical protein n=1 Tax=Fluviicoccus sp. TaxID=2003552 RepID=UPI0027279DB1|nr:hypothetical protein [Fluviicoccus sp.]MDO8331346.1 hypothetical protein [Fluviicoccus sp.]